MATRTTTTLAVLVVLLLAAILLRLLVGGGGLAFPEDPEIWGLRWRRAVLGTTVGAALAIAGVMLQALLRNPLASPDLLGLASGAGLGVMISFFVGSVAGLGATALLGITGPAIAGSFLALGVVYSLSQRGGLIDPIALILVGVIVAIICAAATKLFESLLPDRGLIAQRWLLGALRDDVPTWQLIGATALTAASLAAGVVMSSALDVASMTDDEAVSVGVRLGRMRLSLFLLSGLLTAGTVVLAGPIGFVGLVCPHAVRLAAGPAHRPLMIGSALAGAALVVLADVAVKSLSGLPSGRLPIGVLTSILGGPIFIVLLRRELRVGRLGPGRA